MSVCKFQSTSDDACQRLLENPMTDSKVDAVLSELPGSVIARTRQAATALGLDVSRETLQKIDIYVSNLQKWNRTYNLTAIRNLDDILVNHIFDCLAIIPEIKKIVSRNDFSIVDVGSGAGLPGVIIAACFPESQVICIDSVEKKTTFIRYVASQMGCKNVQAQHNRVESVATIGADIVISRAFASLKLFVDLAAKHVGQNGWMLSMKAAQVKEDIADLEASDQKEWKAMLVQQLKVPESDSTRYLVGLQRN